MGIQNVKSKETVFPDKFPGAKPETSPTARHGDFLRPLQGGWILSGAGLKGKTGRGAELFEMPSESQTIQT
ncbi:hypothetical protein E0W36_09465, partial [Neisseria meningitidis]|nr:hypothetical protein [Neisseria meningitidis]